MTFAAFALGVTAHAAALLLLALQAFAGARVLDRLGITAGVRAHERILFGWALGFSLTCLAGMVLTGLGLLGPVSAGVLLVAMAAVSWPVPRELAADCLRVARTVDLPTRLSVGLGLAALALWVQPLLMQTLLPNSDWDSALYHLPLAERYLEGALFGRDPWFPGFAFPGAPHMSYAVLLALDLERAITPFNFWVTVGLLVTTVALGRRVGGRAGGLWASVLFSTTPVLWQLGADPRIDGFLCLTVGLAVLAVVGFAQEGRDVQLKLAAVALGAAIGCKYTALPFAAAVALVALVFRLRSQTGARGLAHLLVTCGLLVAVPNAAWYGANLVIHGDPLFPMLRGNYVPGPDGEREHLARAHTEEDAESLRDADVLARLAAYEKRPRSDAPEHLFDLFDVVRSPDRYAVKPHHGIGPLLLLSLLLPLALPANPERRRGALLLWVLGWGGWALLGSQTNLVRYVAPVLPLLAASGAVLITRLPWRGVRLAIAITAVLLLVRDFQAERARLDLLRPDEALASPSAWEDPTTRLRWLEQVGYNFTPPIAYATRTVNAMLADGRMPAKSRILMVGEGKGRLLDCESIPDSSWFAHRFVAELRAAGLDHDVLAGRLRDQGITHVLYNEAYYDWVMTDTATARSRLAFALTHIERFLARHGRRIYTGGGMHLYEVREP